MRLTIFKIRRQPFVGERERATCLQPCHYAYMLEFCCLLFRIFREARTPALAGHQTVIHHLGVIRVFAIKCTYASAVISTN